ncbi:MAG: hypothetical protein JWN16_1089 [Alphaproteobacteria bacterium]|nr:hypothetical protein [Alphaproteobacteria bacterium]
MRTRILFAFLLTVLGFVAPAFSGSAVAQPRYAEGRDGIQPLDRLLPGIRRAHPGNFYDAEGPTYGPTGDPHYHLKWMTPEGRVVWFDADARNGRVLRQSGGRDSFDDRAGPPPPGYARPYADRAPYTADPYDRGYGRMREGERYAPSFVPGPRYGNGDGWRGRGDGGGRGFGGRGGGRGRNR